MDTVIMTIKEVAEYRKITEKTTYHLANEDKIPGLKVGGAWRLRQSEVEAWIDRQSSLRKGRAQ